MGNNKIIAAEDCVRVDNDLYFISKDYNILCKLNINTGEVIIIDSIPEERALANRLGAKIIYWKNELYFAPMNASKIWRYNIYTHEWKGFERKHIDNWTKRKHMFQAILYKEKVFFIGCFYPAIVVLDTRNDSLEYIEEPYINLNRKAEEKGDSFFRTDYIQIDNTIFLASCVNNTVFKFNLDTYWYEYYKVGEDDYRYSGIDYDGVYFYLAPRKTGPIVIWDGKDWFETIEIPESMKEVEDAIFGGVVCRGETVFFPACFRDKSLVLYKNNSEDRLKICDGRYYFYKKIDERTIVSFKTTGVMEIIFDEQEYEYDIYISNDVLGKYLSERMKRDNDKLGISVENKAMDLELFIKLL